MNSLYSELQWLLPAPEDFSDRLKALSSLPGPVGGELKTLAQHSMDLNQLTKLAKAIARAVKDGKSLHPLVPFRLAVLSNGTTDLIIPAMVASAARRGVALEVIQTAFDQIAQEALSPDSKVNASKPDAVLLALDFRALPLKLSFGDSHAANATVTRALDYLRSIRDGIKQHSNALCIFQSFAPPPETLFGNLDRMLPGSLRRLIDEVNRGLAEFVVGSNDVVIDVAGVAETVGLANWHNPQLWNLAKLAFSDEFIPLYADHVARILAALRGKSGKVLVLDLDNTIWGGVVGDDGLAGIRIAQGDASGEAHRAVQRIALDLRQRGIVLAISSKNSDSVARAPFMQHPEMLLKLEDIAVFQANWNDKASNIQAIADELHLGLDSIVFLDDNPAERGLVRTLLPEVAVPELPEDPSGYARALAAGGYFEAVTMSVEDLKRAGFYQDNARRADLAKQAEGVDAYLESLNMTVTFQPFDAQGRNRIVQLINKSNQYNLTTRRYTEREIQNAERDPEVFCLQVRLSDIFGDNGMISVVICRPLSNETWEIDTWLMSCRVLGRRVERMVLNEILEHARIAGIRNLRGVYVPTERNQMVADHYAKLGFHKFCEEASGETVWELAVDSDNVSEPVFAKIISSGFGVTVGNA